MNILITGANGQLGNELTSMLSSGQAEIGPIPAAYRGSRVTAVDVDRLDITDSAAVQAFIEAEKPELIINCAAMTNVNGCESAPDTAMKINAIAPRFLAAAAQEIGAKLVHVSTDYVFDGDGARASDDSIIPYTEWDVCTPAASTENPNGWESSMSGRSVPVPLWCGQPGCMGMWAAILLRPSGKTARKRAS